MDQLFIVLSVCSVYFTFIAEILYDICDPSDQLFIVLSVCSVYFTFIAEILYDILH